MIGVSLEMSPNRVLQSLPLAIMNPSRWRLEIQYMHSHNKDGLITLTLFNSLSKIEKAKKNLNCHFGTLHLQIEN